MDNTQEIARAPSSTVELETADLKSLAQAGTLSQGPLEQSSTNTPGNTVAALGRVVIDLSEPPSATPRAPNLDTSIPRKRRTPMPVDVMLRAQTNPEAEAGGMGLVVIVYVLAALALGTSIYFRFFA